MQPQFQYPPDSLHLEVKKISLYVMALLYTTTGVAHFISPGFFRKIVPRWIPFHEALVFISGVFEILFALLLLFPVTRRIAAWCIIALLIAVFPANIEMMLIYFRENKPGLWLTVLRLPFQLVLIWWAHGFTKPLTAQSN